MVLDCFDACPAFHSLFSHVTTEPTLLDSAEGNVGAEHGPRIHRYLARLQRCRHTVCSVDIVGEQSCTQTVI